MPAPIPNYRMPVRIITQYAWHNLFARNMFIQANAEELSGFKPEFVVIDCPGFHAFPEHDKTNSDVFILVNFAKKVGADRRHGIRRRNQEDRSSPR